MKLSYMCSPQIYTRDTRPCAILIPLCGSIWGSSGFPPNKIILVYRVRVLTAYTAVCADKHAENAAWRTKIMNASVLYLLLYV